MRPLSWEKVRTFTVGRMSENIPMIWAMEDPTKAVLEGDREVGASLRR